MNKKVLIIGLIWPEPAATAAGTRMVQLIHFFLNHDYEVNFASAASKNDLSFDLKSLEVNCFSIELNHSSFDIKLKELAPEIVLFDRFLSEEQFGWRVQESCPNAIRILDTEDLHFLRRSRELALKDNNEDWQQYLQNDITKREVASIFRCDISLIISQFEVSLLEGYFKISPSLLFYLPIFDPSYVDNSIRNSRSYEERKHFMTIGNFKHKPNLDAVRFLRESIWPLIKSQLPASEMHVYGAYPSQAVRQLESKKEGFFIKGWVAEKSEAFINYRVCLAPLRFGAGQKGKLLDAMHFGTPSVTTSIGAEGMSGPENWNGFVEDGISQFAEKAILLYNNKELWVDAQHKGKKLLKEKFKKELFEKQFALLLVNLQLDVDTHRTNNFMGTMLSHHTMQSTKYFSKWIEYKNLFNDKIV